MSIFLIVICIIIILIHFGYYTIFFNFFTLEKQHSVNQQNNNLSVSVVICAKNEAQNLKLFLPNIINQKYKKFEVILINDRSQDKTAEILESYAQQYDFIKIVTVKDTEYLPGNKKYALSLGIKAATYDCLLLTDADCSPKSPFWIEEMASQYKKDTKIILGYGSYRTIPKSFLNKLIRFETLTTAIQYFSYAKLGIPYMGVGRNLMYSKTAFLKNKGFHQYLNIMSGDDDLLINQIANKQNTAICFDEKSHTVSNPKTNWKNWVTQKRRHISTAKHYKPLHQFLLGLFSFNRILFWLVLPLGVVGLKNQTHQIFILVLMALKFISEYVVLGLTAKKLKEKSISIYIPFLEFCLIFFQVYIFIFNSISKPKQWS